VKRQFDKIISTRDQASPYKLVIFLIVCLAMGFYAFNTHSPETKAAVSNYLNYQARLFDSNGKEVKDGYYHVRFKIYNAESAGDLLWTETWTDTTSLATVDSGLFSLKLGDLMAFPATLDFQTEAGYWLSVEVGGKAGAASWDGEMSPRKEITAVAYAINAGKLNGQDGDGFAILAEDEIVTGKYSHTVSGTTGDALNLQFTANTNSGANTMSILQMTATQDATDGDALYGLYIKDLQGAAGAGNEYAIYQAGTAWDYGLYVEDDGYFGQNLTVVNQLTLTASSDLVIGTTALGEFTAADDSGAYNVGVYSDGLTYSTKNNVQGVIEDLDAAIAGIGPGGSLFTDAGSFTYLTASTDQLVFGANATADAPFLFDPTSGSRQLAINASTDANATSALNIDFRGSADNLKAVDIYAGSSAGLGASAFLFGQAVTLGYNAADTAGTFRIANNVDVDGTNATSDIIGYAFFDNSQTGQDGLSGVGSATGAYSLISHTGSGSLTGFQNYLWHTGSGSVTGLGGSTTSSGSGTVYGVNPQVYGSGSFSGSLYGYKLTLTNQSASAQSLLGMDIAVTNSGGASADSIYGGKITVDASGAEVNGAYGLQIVSKNAYIENYISLTSDSGSAGYGLTMNGLTFASGDIELSNGSIISNATATVTGFSDGIRIGNTDDTTAGNIRWTGADFEGYTGATWESLTGAAPGGSSLFTDAGTFTYLTASGDDLVIGSNATADAPFLFNNTVGSQQLAIDASSDAHASAALDVNFRGNTNNLQAIDIYAGSSAALTGAYNNLMGQQITLGIHAADEAGTLRIANNVNVDGTTATSDIVGYTFWDFADTGQGGFDGVGSVRGSWNILSHSGAGSLTGFDNLLYHSGSGNATGYGGSALGQAGFSGSLYGYNFALTNQSAVAQKLYGFNVSVTNSGGASADSIYGGKIIVDASGTEVNGAYGLQVVSKNAFIDSYISLASDSGSAGYGIDMNGLTFTSGDIQLSNGSIIDNATATVVGFSDGIRIGNTDDTTAGNLRWTGGDFEGYTGATWASLTGAAPGGSGLFTDAGTFTYLTASNDDLVIGSNATADAELWFNVAGKRLTVGSGYLDFDNNSVAVGPSALAVVQAGGTYNISVGESALAALTTGDYNVGIGPGVLQTANTQSGLTAVGYNAMNSHTGSYNTAVGYSSLSAVSANSYNTAIGYEALMLNTGDYNVAVGSGAMTNNVGANNVAMGNNALSSVATSLAHHNVAIGSSALAVADDTAYYNVAIGFNSMTATAGGFDSVAVGANTLDSNTSGHENVAVGRNSLQAISTNSYSTAVGTDSLYRATGGSNTMIGFQSGYYILTGTYNIGVGYNAAGAGTSAGGNYNIGIGRSTLDDFTTGSYNVALGNYALDDLDTGTYNVAIGSYAGASATTTSDSYKLYISSKASANSNRLQDQTLSLVYGEFASSIANQLFRINGDAEINSKSSDYSLKVFNDGGTTGNMGVWIQAGEDAGFGATNKWVQFADGDGTEGGKIHGNGADGVTYASTGSDYAEYFFSIDSNLVPGEIVCVDRAHSNGVKRCVASSDALAMGVVSTSPAFVGNDRYGDNNTHYKLIGLIGQLPTKVNVENGAIRQGDYLTTSSIPGVAMKASLGDPTIGIALESLFSGSDSIKVLISRNNGSNALAAALLEGSGDLVSDPISAIIGPDAALNLTDSSLAEVLTVVYPDGADKYLEVKTDMKILADLRVEGGLSVAGDLTAEKRIYVSDEMSGVATIASADLTFVKVNFDRPYEELPRISVTPELYGLTAADNAFDIWDGRFVITGKSKEGFTINIAEPLCLPEETFNNNGVCAFSINFSWLAFGVVGNEADAGEPVLPEVTIDRSMIEITLLNGANLDIVNIVESLRGLGYTVYIGQDPIMRYDNTEIYQVDLNIDQNALLEIQSITGGEVVPFDLMSGEVGFYGNSDLVIVLGADLIQQVFGENNIEPVAPDEPIIPEEEPIAPEEIIDAPEEPIEPASEPIIEEPVLPEPTPAEPALIEPVPVEPEPIEPTPVEPAPAEQTPALPPSE